MTILFLAGCAALAFSSPPSDRALEERLTQYLTGRALVFRERVPASTRLRFDSRGGLVEARGKALPQAPAALLFTDVQVRSGALAIRGEGVRVRQDDSGRTYVRSSQRLELISCLLVPEVSSAELTFARVLQLLGRVFLTREELSPSAPARLEMRP